MAPPIPADPAARAREAFVELTGAARPKVEVEEALAALDEAQMSRAEIRGCCRADMAAAALRLLSYGRLDQQASGLSPEELANCW